MYTNSNLTVTLLFLNAFGKTYQLAQTSISNERRLRLMNFSQQNELQENNEYTDYFSQLSCQLTREITMIFIPFLYWITKYAPSKGCLRIESVDHCKQNQYSKLRHLQAFSVFLSCKMKGYYFKLSINCNFSVASFPFFDALPLLPSNTQNFLINTDLTDF